MEPSLRGWIKATPTSVSWESPRLVLAFTGLALSPEDDLLEQSGSALADWQLRFATGDVLALIVPDAARQSEASTIEAELVPGAFRCPPLNQPLINSQPLACFSAAPETLDSAAGPDGFAPIGRKAKLTIELDEGGRQTGEVISGRVTLSIERLDSDPTQSVTGTVTGSFSQRLLGERLAERNLLMLKRRTAMKRWGLVTLLAGCAGGGGSSLELESGSFEGDRTPVLSTTVMAWNDRMTFNAGYQERAEPAFEVVASQSAFDVERDLLSLDGSAFLDVVHGFQFGGALHLRINGADSLIAGDELQLDSAEGSDRWQLAFKLGAEPLGGDSELDDPRRGFRLPGQITAKLRIESIERAVDNSITRLEAEPGGQSGSLLPKRAQPRRRRSLSTGVVPGAPAAPADERTPR